MNSLTIDNAVEYALYYLAVKRPDAFAEADRFGGGMLASDQDAARRVKALLERLNPSGQRITHGRHCTCSACAREDWTAPDLAPCGMHGSSCPSLYQPWGREGTYLNDYVLALRIPLSDSRRL